MDRLSTQIFIEVRLYGIAEPIFLGGVIEKEECMKKFQTLFAWLLLLSMAAYSYSLQGKVVDENGNPISGAKATLLSKNKEALTDANGEFLIEEAQVSLTTGKIPVGSWALQNGVLSISSNSTASFQVKIFDLVGNEIFSKKMSGSGVHSLNLQRISAKGKYVVNLLQGNRREVFALSSTENLSGTFSNGKTSVSESKVFKKEVGENDLLQVVAETFDTLTVPLSNLDTSLTLTLKKSEVQYAFGWAKGNAAVPTRGCGKTWNRVKSGSYEFAWSKGTRTIRIDIPDNYDNHKPYRLVFGMHCMGGWAGGVQQEGYYGLKPLDTQKTTIFVAPEGNGEWAPWGEDDYILFDELLADLEGNLCIDSSRVFSTGFSYGSMFTNGLSRNHQDVLRGVAVYETADINIWLPEHSGKPIAWMGVLGLQDDLCTPELGRSARNTALKYASAEGKDATQEVATEYPGYGEHVCYNYTSVDPRFPVRWCTQNGGHIWDHKDPGATESWVPSATWDFITQF